MKAQVLSAGCLPSTAGRPVVLRATIRARLRTCQHKRPESAKHRHQRQVATTALPDVFGSPYLQDATVCIGAAAAARVWTKLFDIAVEKGLLEKKLSRKLVHMTTGPIFILVWPLFSMQPWARVFAAIVPALNGVRLLAVGTGVVKDEGLVASVSRSGDKGELLKGPLYYCIVLVAATLLCWRENPAGVIAVSLMCGGDGLADIVGRRWGGNNRLPYNSTKSWAGSIAMVVAGTLFAAGMLAMLSACGYIETYDVVQLLPYVAAISGMAALVESLPINQVLDDNLSVPFVTAVVAALILPHADKAVSVL
mmetsp:Transcript_5973/g.15889  ORF Transcript_5973/g.15889 Transcript_5973/m.15889 type:complete len:309 (+) Transcript_5973:131-1057(+)|eukprot:CAMPEP_0202352818 /NCGR_PEP_ID=MMETSP1126-20121109/8847_1 /ASSEMBLY_ACC=CAM_ASM_000457 /TAXON_ID=3047 /ORGANISM="Dunaliella tertiolecta, Strain CCMP1320" /LENGTH=308 /DNA_ID=CAMNT_0048945083 /DNA_START=130 /DNA_END=1056 /DNA_ORIENTATION=+